MPETQVVRQFFRDVADHVEGVKPLPDPKWAAGFLRQIADSEPDADGGWKAPRAESGGRFRVEWKTRGGTMAAVVGAESEAAARRHAEEKLLLPGERLVSVRKEA